MAIVTIDGASASGKSALAHQLALSLQATLLPSGVLYRLIAKWSKEGIEIDNMPFDSIINRFEIKKSLFFLDNHNITDELMSEEISELSSKISSDQFVRDRLLGVQRAWPFEKHLIAEGRDMGSVVFPDAAVKWFVICPLEIRVQRRLKQLLGLGFHDKFEDVREKIIARDLRDSDRSIAPLVQPEGCIVLENTAVFSEHVNYMVSETILRLGVVS